MRNVVRVVFERYPELLFGERKMVDLLGKISAAYCVVLDSTKINPLTPELRYLSDLIGGALMVLGDNYKDFSDEELKNLIGEDGQTLLSIIAGHMKKLPTETELLQAFSPCQRNKYAEKLNRIQ